MSIILVVTAPLLTGVAPSMCSATCIKVVLSARPGQAKDLLCSLRLHP